MPWLSRKNERKEESKDESKDDEAALITDCALHCLDAGSLGRWRAFMEEHEAEFINNRIGDEHALAHTATHAAFVALVESDLEGWCGAARKRHSMAQPQRCCLGENDAASTRVGENTVTPTLPRRASRRTRRLRRRDHDLESFRALCDRLAAEGADEALETFSSLLLMALRFEAFADIMRNRTHREYFFDVLGQWRAALGRR